MTSFVSKACYRISIYEKSTEKLAWLLGFRAFRELLKDYQCTRTSYAPSAKFVPDTIEFQPQCGCLSMGGRT